MDCEEVVRKFEDYRLGQLSPREQKGVEEHIQDCVDCFPLKENNNRPKKNLEFFKENREE